MCLGLHLLNSEGEGRLALVHYWNSPNTDNKSSVSLIKLSAFPQSVFSLCLSISPGAYFLLKKINKSAEALKAHFKCGKAAYSVIYSIQQSVCLCPRRMNKKYAWRAYEMVQKLMHEGENDTIERCAPWAHFWCRRRVWKYLKLLFCCFEWF